MTHDLEGADLSRAVARVQTEGTKAMTESKRQLLTRLREALNDSDAWFAAPHASYLEYGNSLIDAELAKLPPDEPVFDPSRTVGNEPGGCKNRLQCMAVSGISGGMFWHHCQRGCFSPVELPMGGSSPPKPDEPVPSPTSAEEEIAALERHHEATREFEHCEDPWKDSAIAIMRRLASERDEARKHAARADWPGICEEMGGILGCKVGSSIPDAARRVVAERDAAKAEAERLRAAAQGAAEWLETHASRTSAMTAGLCKQHATKLRAALEAEAKPAQCGVKYGAVHTCARPAGHYGPHDAQSDAAKTVEERLAALEQEVWGSRGLPA